MPETPESPASAGTPGRTSLEALADQIGRAQEGLAAATEAWEERTAAIDRRATVQSRVIWVLVVMTLFAVAWGAVNQYRIDGAIRTIAEQQLAACGFHRGWVEIPAAAASAQAARTPGATPSPNPYLDALVAKSVTAYDQGGCVPEFGPLPAEIVVPSVPTPAPSTPAG